MRCLACDKILTDFENRVKDKLDPTKYDELCIACRGSAENRHISREESILIEYLGTEEVEGNGG